MDGSSILLILLAFVCGYFVHQFTGHLIDMHNTNRRSRPSPNQVLDRSKSIAYERGGGSAVSVSSLTTDPNTSISHLTSPIATPIVPKAVAPLSSASTVNTPPLAARKAYRDSAPSSSSVRSPLSGSTMLDPWKDENYRGTCHCGNAQLRGDAADHLPQPDLKCPYPIVNRTIILPINFDKYEPTKLTHPIDDKSSLCESAIKLAPKYEPDVCTAFQATLHSIYFAHHYAFLLNELVENYHYIG
ncbi:hypothetical protein M3Y94_00866800 [Aphelenchoides besseyi]|nr:hypothetical protein M3Y94_00866800 [Aphelenchoides besseyi]KAI6226688.1 hypothetical protein M3Y95_00647100 [Aphelenchoides besseyi]